MADVTTTASSGPTPKTTVTVTATTITAAGTQTTPAVDITDAPRPATLTVAADPHGVPIDPATGKLPASIVPTSPETQAALASLAATKADEASPEFSGAMDFAVVPGTMPPPPGAGVFRLYARDTGSGVPALDYVAPDGFRARLARDLFAQVHNDTGRTLLRGRVVYIVKEMEVAPGVRLPCVDYARADSLATLPAYGWLAQDLAPGQAGRAQQFGRLVPVDTRAWPLTAQLYVSATEAGAVTPTPPPVWQQVVGTVLSLGPGAAGPAPFGAVNVAIRSALPAPTTTTVIVDGQPTEPDLPDLTLWFNNALL